MATRKKRIRDRIVRYLELALKWLKIYFDEIDVTEQHERDGNRNNRR